MLRIFNLASLYIRYRKLIKTTNSVHNINIMYKMGSFLSLIYAQKNCFTIFTSTSFTSSCQTLIKYIKYKKETPAFASIKDKIVGYPNCNGKGLKVFPKEKND